MAQHDGVEGGDGDEGEDVAEQEEVGVESLRIAAMLNLGYKNC